MSSPGAKSVQVSYPQTFTPSMIKAIEALLRARQLARAGETEIWQFAESIAELQALGISKAELRWLLCQGWIQCAEETTTSRDSRRVFRLLKTMKLPANSCFVLAEERELPTEQLTQKLKELIRDSAQAFPAVPPTWSAELRELCVGPVLVKRFRRPAPYQELILSVFQEEGWPAKIDDPLPSSPVRDAKTRLHDTINRLNRHQRNPLIRFSGDGTGQGIRWNFVTKNTKSPPDRR